MSDPLEKLFQAGRAEVPSAAAKAKAAAALGLGGGAVATGVAAATIVKVVVAVAVVGGGAFVGGMQVGEQRAEERYAAQLAELQKAQAAPEPVPSPPPAPEPAPEPQPVVEAPKPKPAAPKEEDTLALELAALDRVRVKMKAEDHAGALTELAGYEKKFPKGAMRTEASLLRIEALLKVGRREDAEAQAQKLLQSPAPELLKQRVKRLLESQ